MPSTMKTMKENSPLKDFCPEKKLINHSARKTFVKKLRSTGIPKCEIKNTACHNSEQGDEDQQRITTKLIDNANWSLLLSFYTSSPSTVYKANSGQLTLPAMSAML